MAKVISGAQTGSDRGALDAAMKLGIPHGGFVPKGRRAEDGRIPDRYRVEELLTGSYPARTRRNVVESDGTIVFTVGAAERGSALTIAICRELGKPHFVVDLRGLASEEGKTPIDVYVDGGKTLELSPSFLDAILSWITRSSIRTLNVAGNRESVSPGIQVQVRDILVKVLSNGREENAG